MRKGIRAVDLRDNQRHVRIHTEGRTVVDINRAALHDSRCEAFGQRILHGAKHIVTAGKAVFTGLLHHDFLSAERNDAACAPCARKESELTDRDPVLLKDLYHFTPNGACCSKYSDYVFFHLPAPFILQILHT